MVSQRAEERRISLRLAGDLDAVMLADELRMKQVVLNLLANAVKFTAPKFSGDAGAFTAGGEITVSACRVDDFVHVTVADNGIGIAKEDWVRIFETFERTGHRTSVDGTGLGLALCKRIVERHEGSIWVAESELGVGSTFEFTVPVSPDSAEVLPDPVAPATSAVTLSARAHNGDRVADLCTVVVIDDDPVDLDLVEAMLTPEGYAVVRASSGSDGIRLVRTSHPGVVLLDLMMPGMDGFEVVEALRADPATADVPIVVLTHKDLTRADRDRLAGRISHLAEKGELGQAALVDLVRRLGAPRSLEGGRHD